MTGRLPRLVAAGAALGLVLLPAAPAAAAGSITTPSSGTTVESHTGVDVQAVVEGRSAETELRLRDPLGVARTVAVAPPSLQDRTLSYLFDTACPDAPRDACAGSAPARNGTWRLELAGGATDSRELVVRVPPRAPSGLQGEAAGPREVVLTWRRGSEPDLLGYVVVDGEGREVSEAGLGACEAPTCRHVVAYSGPGPATEVLAVRARRAACPECAGALTGPTSEPVRVERPGGPLLPGETPPPAEGSPEPSARPSAGASATPGPSATAQPLALPRGTGRSGGTGTADGSGLSFGRTGGSSGGSGVADLPALSGQVDAPLVAPLDDTTFDPELPYGAVPAPQAAPDLALQQSAPGRGGTDLVDEERAARAAASSLVLLLAAGHALRWLRAPSS